MGQLISLTPLSVSIHAPAGGATYYNEQGGLAFKRFNPRTRRGCDGFCHGSETNGGEFQSTHPQGVRL